MDNTIFCIKQPDFSLSETLECGQCFRFRRGEDGAYEGVALGRKLRLRQHGDRIEVSGCTEEEFCERYSHFFALDEDYGAYKASLSEDATLREAIGYAPGIRVMHQPLWETVCSFIISQNNNIPRIMGIVDRLCETFGRDCGGWYDFPSAERLAPLSVEDLAPLRSGFRAKYILDAANRFACGDIDEQMIKTAPLDEARAALMKIKGVGPKVADCALLFGAERPDAFPEDVWIKRAMARLYPNGLPDCARSIAGIAQQYIFHYARTSGIFDDE